MNPNLLAPALASPTSPTGPTPPDFIFGNTYQSIRDTVGRLIQGGRSPIEVARSLMGHFTRQGNTFQVAFRETMRALSAALPAATRDRQLVTVVREIAPRVLEAAERNVGSNPQAIVNSIFGNVSRVITSGFRQAASAGTQLARNPATPAAGAGILRFATAHAARTAATHVLGRVGAAISASPAGAIAALAVVTGVAGYVVGSGVQGSVDRVTQDSNPATRRFIMTLASGVTQGLSGLVLGPVAGFTSTLGWGFRG